MLKKAIGLALSAVMAFGSMSLYVPFAVNGEELSDYEKKINSFDPEYVMWTNQMIDEGFAGLSPNVSKSDLSDRPNPYGKPTDNNLTKWAEYEFLWTHGYPIGNGRMAAVVMGGIDKEVIQINEDTVWTGSPYRDLTTNEPTGGSKKDAWQYYRGANANGTPAAIGDDGAVIGDSEFQSKYPSFKSIANMALNVDNGKSTEAVQHRHNLIKLVENKFLGTPKTQKAYQSFVETYLDFGQKNSGVSNYYKALNMRNATVTVEYDYGDTHYTRETIASYPDQTVATNIKSSGGELDFNAELHTYLENPVFEKVSDNQIKITAKVKDGKANEPGGLSAIKAEGRLYVEAPGSEVSVSPDNNKIIIKGGNEATVYIVGATNYVDYLTLDDKKPNADCERYISKILNKNYQQIKTAHENDYKALFERSYITLENTKAFKSEGIPTEKRVRKDVNGKSGFSVAAGNSVADGNKNGVHSTIEDGDNKIAILDFNYGKYLMIAGSRDQDTSKGIPMSQPLNLTGKWNSALGPSWNGKYTININTEMNYWLAQPLNLPECEKPLLDSLIKLAESGSITAREHYAIYNSRGDNSYKEGDPWVMHHNYDLWRGTQPIDNATAGVWPTGGAWLLDHAWQYYLYNHDKEYLAKFYPIMKGASDFFTQFLVVDPKTGYLVTAASCSPEQGSVQPGPAMDTQLIRNLYNATIQAAEILGKTSEDATLIAKMKEQLPAGDYLSDEAGKIAPNLIDGNGYIKEWARGDVTFDLSSGTTWTVTDPFTNQQIGYKEHSATNSNGHRHCSHLWEFFPGTHISAYSDDENERNIFEAYQKTVTARGAGDGKGWGLAWRTALSARALDGESAYARIEQLLRMRTSPNMFGQHPNFQIDCNYGMTAGITEMLMQSHDGVINILPAIPERWGAGQFKGFKARGDIEVGAKWKGGIPTRVDIKAAKSGQIKVRNPYMGTAMVKDADGNEVSSELESDNKVIMFNAESGVEYNIVGFGEIPQEEGTRIETWTKTDVDAGDFFNDGGGQVPKPNGKGGIGTLLNNYCSSYTQKGEPVGFSYKDCVLDDLTKLTIKMNVRPADVTISVRRDSKDGEEIASVTAAKVGAADIDIPIKENANLKGTTKLFVVFTAKNETTTDKYIGDVEYLKGERTVTFVNSDILKVQKDGEAYIKNAISAGDYTFEVDFEKLEGIEKATVIVAYYDDNNTLISDTKKEITKTDNKVDVTVTPENAKYTMKVMIWNDLDSIKPIRAVKEFV